MGRSQFLCTALLVTATGFEVGVLPGRAAAPTPPVQQAAPAVPAPNPVPAAQPAPSLPLLPRQVLPLAPKVLGPRPKSNPKVMPPAAKRLPADQPDLAAPAPLALPNQPQQVRIEELRPISLEEAETIAEVNSPDLKIVASQVDQAQSALRAEIARWYPTLSLNANSFPATTTSQRYNRRSDAFLQQNNGVGGYSVQTLTAMDASLQATWALIDPRRVPAIAAARDRYEQAKNAYLITLRELRLQVAEAYFDLQNADEQVRIGQESVRASLVSLRDAQARFQAGVATKLEVLEAQTQLARDQQLLTQALYGRTAGSLSPSPGQAIARRELASLLDLPQNVTPTAKDPARVVGTWIPSLQESIVAAYTFREELDQILLDISIANSTANRELAEVQPVLNLFNRFGVNRSTGSTYSPGREGGVDPLTLAPFSLENQPERQWQVDNAFGVNVNWTIFDGGRARALYRQNKQKAKEETFNFSKERDKVRSEVEASFYDLLTNNRNIVTTSNEVLSARESLRLARLRFQAGVTTQREVVDTQRDLTQAEVRYTLAITNYNKNLAELRRRTGLDLIALCQRPNLPSLRPASSTGDVPIEPTPLVPACQAGGLSTRATP
ncbi:MAG: TolC family protein [Cyanobacteriota bacterium]|nr:TolC family protein [Cyanobacteriota bacterium]